MMIDEDKYGLRCMGRMINMRTQMKIRCEKAAWNDNDNYDKLYNDEDDGSGIIWRAIAIRAKESKQQLKIHARHDGCHKKDMQDE